MTTSDCNRLILIDTSSNIQDSCRITPCTDPNEITIFYNNPEYSKLEKRALL